MLPMCPFLSKKQLMEEAQPHSDSPFQKPDNPDSLLRLVVDEDAVG